MEKISPSTLSHSFSLAEPLVFLFLYIILNTVIKLHKSSLRFLSSLGSCITSIATTKESTEARGEERLSREDVEMVLERLKMSSSSRSSHEGVQLKEFLGFDELSTMFEEREPSLEEVMETFSVFDANCDGFIDAMELHRVFCNLGFGGGFRLDDCEQMIAVHDENQDGRIDFNEFVKFLESTLR